jgi:hypothetical protein
LNFKPTGDPPRAVEVPDVQPAQKIVAAPFVVKVVRSEQLSIAMGDALGEHSRIGDCVPCHF